MPHPSEALLIAFADETLDAEGHRETAAHMATCAVCRHALRDLREAMAALKVEVALVDTREPDAWRAGGRWRESSIASDATRVRPLAGNARTKLSDRGAASRGWWGSASVAMRRAAAVLLVVGGGAAAMTAPRWRHLLSRNDSATPVTASASTAAIDVPVAPAPLSAPAAAVSVLPVDGEALVSLLEMPAPAATANEPSQSPARMVVRVSDRRDVQVTVTSTPRGAGSERVPRFLTGDGKLEVQLAGAGAVVEVEFPSTLRSARVTHDGRTVVSVRGTTVVPGEAAAAGILLTPGR
ncbi:MAG: hypothetical protein IT359_15830 [Gemmatimonadaceae bacterium]|nr:hypothetical protein [Gemmatimonadaceae bacterium]